MGIFLSWTKYLVRGDDNKLSMRAETSAKLSSCSSATTGNDWNRNLSLDFSLRGGSLSIGNFVNSTWNSFPASMCPQLGLTVYCLGVVVKTLNITGPLFGLRRRTICGCARLKGLLKPNSGRSIS